MKGKAVHSASDTANAGIGSQVSFALAATWVIMMPRAMMSSSTVIYTYPLGTALAFVIILIGVAAIDQSGTARMRARMFAACTALGAFAGIVFLLVPDTFVRLACFGLSMVTTAELLVRWGRVLNGRPLNDVRAHALAGLGMVALFHFGALGIGAVLSAVGNSHAFSSLTLAILSVVLVLAGVMGHPGMGRPATTTCSQESEEVATDIPASYLLILCIASLLTSFVSGFIYLPYHYDWNLVACLRSGIMLAAAAFAVLHRMRQPVFTTASLNGFFLFSLLLTIGGLALATWTMQYSGFIAQGSLEAARDCYFILTFMVFARAADSRGMPFFPFFALGMLGCGLYWSYDLGVFSRKLFGYDPSILVPLASLCTAALAIAFFLLFIRNPSQTRSQVASESHLESRHAVEMLESAGSDASGREENRLGKAVSDMTPSTTPTAEQEAEDDRMDTPELDAASARQIIEKAYEELLAPYRLSPREMQVSMLVIDGYTAAGASGQLGISIATVKFHLGNCYRKIGIQSKAELIALAKSDENPSATKATNAERESDGGTPHER